MNGSIERIIAFNFDAETAVEKSERSKWDCDYDTPNRSEHRTNSVTQPTDYGGENDTKKDSRSEFYPSSDVFKLRACCAGLASSTILSRG